MKKLVLILILIPFLIGMTVVYENETGEIKAIGPFPNYKPKIGQSAVDVPNASTDQIKTHRIDDGEYREKTDQEKKSDKDLEKAKKDEKKAKKQAAKSKLQELGIDPESLRDLIREGSDD